MCPTIFTKVLSIPNNKKTKPNNRKPKTLETTKRPKQVYDPLTYHSASLQLYTMQTT